MCKHREGGAEARGGIALSIRERLRPVFREALSLGPDEDVEIRQHGRGERQWNSVGHLALVAAIEDEFDVEFDVDQIVSLVSFETVVRTLEELGVDDD